MSEERRIKISREFMIDGFRVWLGSEFTPPADQTPIESFKSENDLLMKAIREITPGDYSSLPGHPMNVSKEPETIELVIAEMNKCTAIDKKNALGVQEGLLAYADKFLDSPKFREAYDAMMEKLK